LRNVFAVRDFVAVVAAVLAWPSLAAPAAAPLPGDSVYQLHASLVDSAGHRLEWSDLRGRARIATMFYTSCRYICPLVVDSLRAIERRLTPAERERLGFVLISMDPERDTPAALAKVVHERRLDASRWTLLQPRADELRGLAGMLGVRYRGLADGEFNHSTVLVLLDRDGRVLARTEQLGADLDPAFLAAVRKTAAASGTGSDR
jgi:protein SCO1/2